MQSTTDSDSGAYAKDLLARARQASSPEQATNILQELDEAQGQVPEEDTEVSQDQADEILQTLRDSGFASIVEARD